LYVTSARDGTNRLFIVEQGGVIKVLQPGATTPTVFLDITAKVLSGGERGLLGLAFHPQYATNRRFFVNYTSRPDGDTVIAEYQASSADPDLADASETVLLVIDQPFTNHNGGMIEFGPDGFLYIGMGDGGSGNDPGNRAQNINDLLGKMLRINIDIPSGGLPYSSPADNPFFGPTAGRDEIYAVGFRNPFRFSFDRGGTRQLYAGDVGQSAREEIDIVTLGGNFGWRVFEGTLCTGLDPPQCGMAGFTAPIAEYDHSGGRCSVIGGYVYRGTKSTFPMGAYIYGDFCTGEIFQLFPATSGGTPSLLLDTTMSISSFGENEAGEIFVVDLGGAVFLVTGETDGDTSTIIVASDGGTCIIATSVYGSPLAAEVQVFREFRDRYLLTHMPGRLLVSAYYRLSPPLARAIAASESLRAISRTSLQPLVWWVRLSLVSPVLAILSCAGIVLGSLALGAVLTRVLRRGKSRGSRRATELSGLDATARTAPRPR
ncbi:MAG: PQQ-dependent sugar dehydrogenase, partial [Candidatus Methylomirabilota bacterium]